MEDTNSEAEKFLSTMEDPNSEDEKFLSTLGDPKSLYCTPQKHPFQIDGLPGSPYQLIQTTLLGFYVRLDLPGVPLNGLNYYKKPVEKMVTFSARAPRKKDFPFDESERVYGGFLKVNRNPLVIPIKVHGQNGCFFMHFPDTEGSMFCLPSPKSGPGQTSGEGSGKSAQGEGSPSGKSMNEAHGSGKSESVKNLLQVSIKGSEKSEQDAGSSEKSIHKPEGYVKPGSVEISPSHSVEGSAKLELGKGTSSGKPIDKAESSGKPGSSKSSSKEDHEAWIRAWIKRHILLIEPEPIKDVSLSVETSLIEQSSHEVPEIAIGSVEDCGIHSPGCQCQQCDSNGLYLKLWSKTEDIIDYMHKLKIQGPDGVCQKRVVKEGGLYSLYVRADLPGLEPSLCVTTVWDRCILVYGKLQPEEQKVAGARNYLFFVQLRCSCCKFNNLQQDHRDGVLRMFCKIIGPGPGPSAD